jgi:hypothetical protein
VTKYKGQLEEIYYSRLLSLVEENKKKADELRERVRELEEKFTKEDPYVFKRKYLEQ